MSGGGGSVVSRWARVRALARRRAGRGALVSAAGLALLAADATRACGGLAAATEGALAALLAAGLLLRAMRPRPKPVPLTRGQAVLLGLDPASPDSSFRVVEEEETQPPREEPLERLDVSATRTPADSPPPPPPPPPPAPPLPPPPPYATAALQAEPRDEAAAAPHLCRRLDLDPRHLTQYNLNLRLWLHATILERLVREMDAVDERLPDAKLGELGLERLRKTAASAHAPPALRALLPYLEPFAEQRYVVRRLRELAVGGALGRYRWDGGGAGWDEAKPTDAELVLHLFVTYLDAQAGAEGALAARLVSAGGRAPRGPGLHRASLRPPHYLLRAHAELLDAGRGRANLLHSLLLLVALCARDPPAPRLQLGRAGLNLLWVIGR